jgi:hypothetical protein
MGSDEAKKNKVKNLMLGHLSFDCDDITFEMVSKKNIHDSL